MITKSNRPSIAVLMTVYNKSRYLERSVNSLINQTSHPDALYIVEDCSTDNSRLLLETMSPTITNSIKKFDLILLSKNSGAAAARNNGLDKVSEDYIIFLDADDSYDINYIYQIRNIIERQKDVGMICSAVKMESDGNIYPSKRILSYCTENDYDLEIKLPFDALSHESIFIGGGNVCFSRTVMGSERFDPNEKNMEEWDFYYRVLKNCISKGSNIYLNNVSYYLYNDIDQLSLSRKQFRSFDEIRKPRLISSLNDNEEKGYKSFLLSIWLLNTISRIRSKHDKIRFITIYHNDFINAQWNRYLIGAIINLIMPVKIFDHIKKWRKRLWYNK